MRITREVIEECKTARGGFLGVTTRIFARKVEMTKGWPSRLIGQELTSAEMLQILNANEATDKSRGEVARSVKKGGRMVRERAYPPNDGSKSEWAQTPEGREWWSKSWLHEEKAPWE